MPSMPERYGSQSCGLLCVSVSQDMLGVIGELYRQTTLRDPCQAASEYHASVAVSWAGHVRFSGQSRHTGVGSRASRSQTGSRAGSAALPSLVADA